jgi:acetyl-CoA acyltransferase
MAGRWRQCAPMTWPRSRSARSGAQPVARPLTRIDEVLLGDANQAGEDNRNVARMAALLAGLPVSVPGLTLNRLCASGMDAVGFAARGHQGGGLYHRHGGRGRKHDARALRDAESRVRRGRQTRNHDTTIGWRFVNPAMRRPTAPTPCPRRRTTWPRISASPAPIRTPSRCAARNAWAKGRCGRCFRRRDRAGDHSPTQGRSGRRDRDEHPRPGHNRRGARPSCAASTGRTRP